ncbi:hypothetical protein MD484_g2619, partial [Candolleomyces efflorescens]
MFEHVNHESNALLVEEEFVGKGMDSSVLLTINEADARVVLPEEIPPAVHVPMPKDIQTLDSVTSTYLGRAAHTYASVFNSWKLDNTDAVLSFLDTAERPAFAALDVSKLQDLRQLHGPQSKEYQKFAAEVRQFLEEVVHDSPNLNIAILTYGSSSLESRQEVPRQSQNPFPDRPLPQEPIGAISTCFTTTDACQNNTNSCSGRGKCVEASKGGRSCFVCACGVTTKGDGPTLETTKWAGESCERQDVSSSFVLLAGTVLVLLIIIFGSISLLYSVGDQALPSILLATAVNSKKD